MGMIRFLAIVVLVLLALLPLHQAGANVREPVVFSGAIAGDEQATRIFFDFDQNSQASYFFMDRPDRLIIDLDEVVFNLPEDGSLAPRGLVSDVKYGRISEGRSRIVFMLAAPVAMASFDVRTRKDGSGSRLVVDLKRSTQAAFQSKVDETAERQRQLLAKKGDRVAPKRKREGRFTIVLDPGHGGIDGGAEGRGKTKEKDITLNFTKILAVKLEQSGPYDVKLTREEDVFVSLRERLDFSRRQRADLFISIHADSLNQRFVRGSTVYTLSKKASDGLSERLARSENAVDLVAGVALPQEQNAVTDILIDLTTRETTRFSKQFSRILVTRLGKSVKLIKNPQRSAAFGVLKAPEVPSVLLELGYLSNREDEKLLISPEWQSKAADAVVAAVEDFFSPRLNEN